MQDDLKEKRDKDDDEFVKNALYYIKNDNYPQNKSLVKYIGFGGTQRDHTDINDILYSKKYRDRYGKQNPFEGQFVFRTADEKKDEWNSYFGVDYFASTTIAYTFEKIKETGGKRKYRRKFTRKSK